MESDNAEFFEHIYLYKTRLESSSGRMGLNNPEKNQKRMKTNEESPRRNKLKMPTTSFGSDFITFLLESETQTLKEAVLSREST